MKKILASTILLFIACFSLTLKAEKRKILFIGNSYTYVNDLPNTLKSLALSMGDSIEFDSSAPGGMTLNGHTTNATTLAKIQLGGWDYVIIQAQSQEPSFAPTQVMTDTYPYAKILDSLVQVSNPCAETIFYMTWGRKNGDASNCPFYPPVCTYAGMQQRLRESYLEMCLNNQATCAPAGEVWRTVRTNFPSIELYNADESHPSLNGTYLVACSIYSTIYHKSTLGASYVLGGVLAADATNIQTLSSALVLDSLETWQSHGSLPFASFNLSNTSNQYSFTNTSLRSTQYEWNFGDGSTVNTQMNPNHTFNAIGTYTVTLTSINSCGKYDKYSKTIQVNSIPNSINESENASLISVMCFGKNLKVMNTKQAEKIKIFSINGSLIQEVKLSSDMNHIAIDSNAKGIYLYEIISGKKMIQSGRFEIN